MAKNSSTQGSIDDQEAARQEDEGYGDLPELQANGQRGDRQGAGFEEALDNAEQARYDREFAGLTAPEHYSQDAKKPPTPQQMKDLEEGAEAPGAKSSSWYASAAKRAAKHEAKRTAKYLGVDKGEISRGLNPLKKFAHRQKKFLITTLIINAAVALAVIAVMLLSPLKHMHFETILRSVNFARYQILVRKQFTKIIFNAAVLTDESAGDFKKSPLVRQILLGNPDRQVKALGRDDRLKFEFHKGMSFGGVELPFTERLKAVVVDGVRVDLDEMSKDLFGGRAYRDLTFREKLTMQARFVEAVHHQMGDVMAWQARTVKWNPYKRLRLRADIRLIKWLNNAREYIGKSPPESRALHIDETAKKVMPPDSQRVESGSSDTNEDAEARRTEVLQARKEGRTPGEIRSKLAARIGPIASVSDAVFVATITCIVRDLALYFTNGQAVREMQALRFAADMMTATDQQKAGDTVGEAVGALNSSWDSDGRAAEPPEHPLYGLAVGEPYSASAENDAMMLKVPLLSYGQFFEKVNEAAVNFIDGGLIGVLTGKVSDFQRKASERGCNFILDKEVQQIVALAELVVTVFTLGTAKGVTAGIKTAVELGMHAAVGYGLGELLNWMIGMAIDHYSQTAFSLEQGSDRFAAGFVAENYAAQTGTRNITYGRPMSQAEANASQQVAMADIRLQNQQSSFANRYLAIENPYSLLGQTVARIPTSTGGLVNTMRSTASLLGSVLSSPFKLAGSLGKTGLLFTPAQAAQAASLDTSFGVEQWGWSEAEQRRIDTEPSFELISVISKVEPRIDELNERYGECYDDTTYVLQTEKPDKCTKEFLSGRHPEFGDDALYWRYYNSLMFAAVHLTGPV